MVYCTEFIFDDSNISYYTSQFFYSIKKLKNKLVDQYYMKDDHISLLYDYFGLSNEDRYNLISLMDNYIYDIVLEDTVFSFYCSYNDKHRFIQIVSILKKLYPSITFNCYTDEDFVINNYNKEID